MHKGSHSWGWSTYYHEINQVHPLVNHNPIQLPYIKHSIYIMDTFAMILQSIIETARVCLIIGWWRKLKEVFNIVFLSRAHLRGNRPSPLGVIIPLFILAYWCMIKSLTFVSIFWLFNCYLSSYLTNYLGVYLCAWSLFLNCLSKHVFFRYLI